MRKDALTKGGHGRGLQNKMSKTSKRNLDRKIDKRRRRQDKTEENNNSTGYGGSDPDNYCGGY